MSVDQVAVDCDCLGCRLNCVATGGVVLDRVQVKVGEAARTTRERFPASYDFPEAVMDAQKLWSSRPLRRARDSVRQNLGR